MPVSVMRKSLADEIHVWAKRSFGMTWCVYYPRFANVE